jgi:SAM-dependent methyltransferase
MSVSHSVASHLAISPAKYDARIRSLIPLYDELIAAVARALDHAGRPVRTIVDLGIGTGALARTCLERAPGARLWGIDADEEMMATARTRLGRLSRRVTMVTGSFLEAPLPSCDAMVASYSLHHIRTTRAKLRHVRRSPRRSVCSSARASLALRRHRRESVGCWLVASGWWLVVRGSSMRNIRAVTQIRRDNSRRN